MKEEKEIIRKYYDDDPKKEWDRLKKRFPHEKIHHGPHDGPLYHLMFVSRKTKK